MRNAECGKTASGRSAFRIPHSELRICPRSRAGFVAAALLAGVCGACGLKPLHYPADLGSPHPGLRARAVQAAVARNDPAAVPLLVDRLEDEDVAIRLYAAQALRRLTGKDFNYRYYRPLADRTLAIERWRRYVHSSAHDAPPTPTQAPSVSDGTRPRD